MANTSAGAYGLTLLCPIKRDIDDTCCGDIVRNRLEALPLNEASPMAKVPNTYLCRFYVLDDVFYESYPACEEHLKSRYLVFCANFHGTLEAYLEGMWRTAEREIRQIWEHCVAFEHVRSVSDFISYIKRCQVDNDLFFNGSNGAPLDEQLKSLYVKQEFSRFVYDNYGKSAEELQRAFEKFVSVVKPENLAGPTWAPGMTQDNPQHHYNKLG